MGVTMATVAMRVPSITMAGSTTITIAARRRYVTKGALLLAVIVHIPAAALEDNGHQTDLPFSNLATLRAVRNGLSIEALSEFKTMLTFCTLVIVRGHSAPHLAQKSDLYL